VLGLADDAAAVPFDAGFGDGDALLVASVDSCAASTHFPAAMPMEDRGWLAAAAALSDLAAKGAEPLGLLVALGLPVDFDVADAEAVARGLAACADACGTEVLGGDTKPALELTVTCSVLGRVARKELLPRTGIVAGDVLAVTGELGGAAAGLAALERHSPPARVAQRLFRPTPRFAEGRTLAASGAARACMDLSDGLSSSLHTLAGLNPVGFRIEAARVPLSRIATEVAAERDEASGAPSEMTRGRDEALQWALHGGGDYELLVVLKPSAAERAQLAVAAAGGRLTFLGHATRERGVRLAREAGEEPLPDEGWEHFRQP